MLPGGHSKPAGEGASLLPTLIKGCLGTTWLDVRVAIPDFSPIACRGGAVCIHSRMD